MAKSIETGIDLAGSKDETVVTVHCGAHAAGKMRQLLIEVANINPDRILIIEAGQEPTFILAGCEMEYKHFITICNLDPVEHPYLNDPDRQLQGRHWPVKILKIGTYYQRKDVDWKLIEVATWRAKP
jgi:hypothetical protein